MKKTNLRIKENITLQDKINVVESIVEDYFRGGKYTPYFAPISKIVSIATYFIEGYELEDGDNLYTICMTDDDMKRLIETFVGKYAVNNDIMAEVNSYVEDKVDFMKSYIIHENPDLSTIVEAANVIIESLANFANMNVELMNPENLKSVMTVVQKLKDSNLPITQEMITDIIRDAAAINFDDATKEIMDAKNKEIRDLKEENRNLRKFEMLYNSRNVSNK
nr:MAG TPA: hypothetical protein [Caudoviricetes sp.]